MCKNEFVAFKALFNKDLQVAINYSDLRKINNILNAEYKFEGDSKFYKDVALNIDVIKDHYNKYSSEIDDNPHLINKL